MKAFCMSRGKEEGQKFDMPKEWKKQMHADEKHYCVCVVCFGTGRHNS